MPYTMQKILDKARYPLNDAAKTAHSDAKMLSYAVDALLIVKQRRPDLFFGQYLNLPDIGALVVGSDFPIDDAYGSAIADYVTARCETGNDESVIEQRANLFFDLFKSQI